MHAHICGVAPVQHEVRPKVQPLSQEPPLQPPADLHWNLYLHLQQCIPAACSQSDCNSKTVIKLLVKGSHCSGACLRAVMKLDSYELLCVRSNARPTQHTVPPQLLRGIRD